MKVKIESEKAALLFGCEVGEHRDLQKTDALPLIEGGDVSAVGDGDLAPPAKPKPARRAKK